MPPRWRVALPDLRMRALVLILALGLTSCAWDQPGPWKDEPKPWDAKSIQGACRVTVHETGGHELVLFRTAIMDANGEHVIVGRVWDPREGSESRASIRLSRIERMETQRLGPTTVGTDVSQMLCFTYTA